MQTLALAALLAAATAATPEPEDSLINQPGTPYAFRLHAEIGLLAVLDHRYQVGTDGDYVDLVRDAGQDNLFFFVRPQLDLDVGKRRLHTLSFLYQPLDLVSKPVLRSDTQVGDVVFGKDTPMRFRYGFGFWRLTWMMDALPAPDKELALGLGLQIRNATIVWESLDGEQAVATRDIGPVPLLALRGRGTLKGPVWMGGEVQGFYAPVRVLNGDESDVIGAIADVSLKVGLALRSGADPFLSIRYLGGGAVGQSSEPDPLTDGYTRNWLHFLTAAVGVTLR